MMLIFLKLISVSSIIFDIPASQVSAFIHQHSEEFQVLYFCDFSTKPCKIFTQATNPFFNRIQGKVAKVNTSPKDHVSNLEEYNIKDLPYIIYIRPGKKHEVYQGSLEPAEIFSFVERIQKGPSHYSSLEAVYTDLETTLYSDGLVLAYRQKSFVKVAVILLPFFPLATAGFGLELFGCGSACVVVFRPNILQYKGRLSYSVIKGQADEESITEEYYKDLSWLTPTKHIWFNRGEPLITLYGKISGKIEPAHTQHVIDKYLEAVQENFEEFIVTVARIDDFQSIMNDIGIGGFQSLIMIDDSDDIFFEYDVITSNYSVNTRKIKKFVKDYKSGSLLPYMYSDPVPETEYENNIKVLVGSTAKTELASIKKDSVLLVYTGFEDNIENFIHHFEYIAEKLHRLQFFKLKAHKNYVPPAFITVYPALFYLKPGQDPQPIEIDLDCPEKNLQTLSNFH